jgi:hypothetical protein
MSEHALSSNAADDYVDLSLSAQALASASPSVRIAELQHLAEAVAKKCMFKLCHFNSFQVS